ncbi:MAG TPA: gamma-glutamyl-gamma-aminobutyrate hydrolase family protein [Bryobacteraceae bacterium]|nr:gamma-glutamyl-gamma-aminobutyrate hydrolase family protein [Bryobacteraceae bacterium]
MRAGVTFKNAARLGPYELALREAGIEVVRNPASIDSLDGLLLTGGSDVDPARYGERRVPEAGKPDPARDEMEARLLTQAGQAQLPVLAICRGLQLMNVVYGGTLIQHLASVEIHRRQPQGAEEGKHPAAHRIRVTEGTRLAAIIGAGEHEVNSRHHQAAARLGQALVVSAVSADGVIEGLEDPRQPFAIAVQWHPEDRIRVSAADRQLFAAFAAAMQVYSLGPQGRKSRSTADQPGHPRLSA